MTVSSFIKASRQKLSDQRIHTKYKIVSGMINKKIFKSVVFLNHNEEGLTRPRYSGNKSKNTLQFVRTSPKAGTIPGIRVQVETRFSYYNSTLQYKYCTITKLGCIYFEK